MSERGVGKPWTTYEDNLLIQAVAIHGENDNWKAVAASVPGRTNKACRKRWLHSLSPNVKKTAWTQEEDQLLLSLFAVHGTKWSVIARNIPGRTDDACSKRYREALDPSLKRDDWTSAEDVKLLDAYSRLGGKWGIIGQELNRSGLGCRNRWRMLERKRAALIRDNALRQETPSAALGPSSAASQWTPNHVQEPPFWDGRSPQYVTPSVLYQGSPPHAQESHAASYSPEQILSGAHLNGQSSNSRDPPPFPYVSSSLSAALSHPNSVVHTPNPHDYYHSSTFSPSHSPDADGPSNVDISISSTRPRSYGSQAYEFMSIRDRQDEDTIADTHQQGDSHRFTPISPVNGSTGHSLPEPMASSGPAIPPISPATPSPAGSPSFPRSPTEATRNEPVDYTDVPDTTDGVTVTVHGSYYRTAEEKALMNAPTRKLRSTQLPARLSSSLPATADPNVFAYACGHRDCWSEHATTSNNAFLTSKELSDHSKTAHSGDLGGSKPFRCGLVGCEKSWKSLNGLQYHLQISRYHFQQALASRNDNPDLGNTATEVPDAAIEAAQVCDTVANSGTGEPPHPPAEASSRAGTALTQEEPSTGSEKPKRKLHPCPHQGCSKQYKQLSGLRYHLTHFHVDVLPLQLDTVPPTLARMVAEKDCATRN